MFSVVIPLYNKERSVKNTIESVLNQTFQDFEVIVVNDGSTDNSLEVVKSFNDERIRIINQKNSGVSSARNRGIKEAKYDWIAFLDADDLWLPKYLETIRNLMIKYPQASVLCTGYSRNNYEKTNKNTEDILITDYFSANLSRNLIWTSSVVIHRSCFIKCGNFDVNLTHGEDIEMWIRLAKKYLIAYNSKILVIYKIDAENRACKRLPEYEKHIASRINLRQTASKNEKKYYSRLLTTFFFDYFHSNKKIISLKLLTKHNFYIMPHILKRILRHYNFIKGSK